MFCAGKAMVAAFACMAASLIGAGNAEAMAPSATGPEGLSSWCTVHNYSFYDNVSLGATYLGTGTDFKAGERVSIDVVANWGSPTDFVMQIPDGNTVASTTVPGTVAYTFPSDVTNGTIRLNTIGGGVIANWSCAPDSVQPTPEVAFLSGETAVDESGTAEHTYTYSITNPGAGTPTMDVACGPVGKPLPIDAVNTTSGGSFRCIFPDGPAQYSVLARARSAAGVTGNIASRLVTVSNVAPTVTLSPSTAMGITGVPFTFSATASDASGDDEVAGFYWRDNGAPYTQALSVSPRALPVTATACGTTSVSVQAMDRDAGQSNAATASLAVYNATFGPPLTEGVANLVQKGRVVPVKVTVGCAGRFASGLSPSIELLSSDLNASSSADAGDAVVTMYAPSADTVGVMRQAGDKYIYNLRVPDSTATGAKFTIRVRPFGPGTAAIGVVIQIRR